jgi:hypothetical protein
VEQDGLQLQSGIASGGTAASWPDAEVLQITFPNVQKGDRTGWRMRIVTHTPPLSGWVSLTEYLLPWVQVDRFNATLEAPQSFGLQVVAVGLQMTTASHGPDQVWTVTGSQRAMPLVANAANLKVTASRVLASSYKDPLQLGAAFSQKLNGRLIVTDDVRKVAAEITRDATTPKDKLEAIHRWVRKNIRYVAVYLGVGGWVPHEVDWILKNGYGDCKDHVLLMLSLLKAVDIEAAPVLIDTTNNYVLAELPSGFNHCIVYLPDLALFVDPTDSRIPLGGLPWADADKPVVVVLASGARLMRTPAFTAAGHRATVKTRLRIDGAGKASGEVGIDAAGMPATTLQDRLEEIPAAMRDTVVERILGESQWRGRGAARYAEVQRDVQAQSLTFTGLEIDNLLDDPTAGTLGASPALRLPVYIRNSAGNYTAPRRIHAVTCAPITSREEFELTFDPVYELLRVPSDFQEVGPDGIAFEAHYLREGNTVKGWRQLTLSHLRHVCSPADYALRRPAMERITQHLRSGILFRQ